MEPLGLRGLEPEGFRISALDAGCRAFGMLGLRLNILKSSISTHAVYLLYNRRTNTVIPGMGCIGSPPTATILSRRGQLGQHADT